MFDSAERNSGAPRSICCDCLASIDWGGAPLEPPATAGAWNAKSAAYSPLRLAEPRSYSAFASLI